MVFITPKAAVGSPNVFAEGFEGVERVVEAGGGHGLLGLAAGKGAMIQEAAAAQTREAV
jgi:hypothetical protein